MYSLQLELGLPSERTISTRNSTLIKGRREAVQYPQTIALGMAVSNLLSLVSHYGTSWLIPALPVRLAVATTINPLHPE
jgi:hypothetical protein